MCFFIHDYAIEIQSKAKFMKLTDISVLILYLKSLPGITKFLDHSDHPACQKH